jgi:hypothetical protein
MSQSLSVLNPAIWEPTVQDYLNNILVAMEVAETRFKSELSYGDTINFPALSDTIVQTYTPGADLTPTDMVATQSALSINQRKAVVSRIDRFEQAQARADFAMSIARQAAFRLANQIDKDLLGTAVTYAGSTATGGSITVGTMYSTMVDAYAQLWRNNAVDGVELCAIMPPKFTGLLSQTFVANGFNEADNSLRNGFKGKAHQFSVYSSNNLPASVTLSMATNPTAGDTFTINGVTWTFRANGTAAVAGEISISSVNAAATQTSVLQAINGTGTPGASNYIEISVDDRFKLTNNAVTCGTWGSDIATITGVGYLNPSETFTAAGNVFGTETTSLLFMRKGAVALGMQLQPNLEVSDIPLQFGKYYKTGTLYGTKVFSRDANRIYKLTVNA